MALFDEINIAQQDSFKQKYDIYHYFLTFLF